MYSYFHHPPQVAALPQFRISRCRPKAVGYSLLCTAQALHKVEDDLLVVTQEQSVYREELKESKRQSLSHCVQGTVFVPPPPPHATVSPASISIIMADYYFDFVQ